MTRLAAPSLGSAELSVWRVRMTPGAQGPVHTVDREQVWTVTSGVLEFTVGERTGTAAAGQAVTVPAGAVRRIRAARGAAKGAAGTGDAGTEAEALVAMACGATVEVAGSGERIRLPWAE
ncbi:cupin [Streptomyces carminius]|uniref:Cupin n=2 Tax=Streptomyces carminius TaxID=2665496 RepID=A0A2M8M5L7_9ACTN|nr:cupin [Streptomyces carminius]